MRFLGIPAEAVGFKVEGCKCTAWSFRLGVEESQGLLSNERSSSWVPLSYFFP